MTGLLGTISGQVRLDIRQAVAAYATLRAQNARTMYALRGTGDSFVAAGRTMTVAGGAMLYMFGKAIKASADFERKMSFFGAVSAATSEDIDRVSASALTLAETSIYSADKIADGFVELGKAGVDAQMIIDGIGQAMVNLGAAGDIPLEQSGQVITSTLQQFDLHANKAVHVVDMLAGAANASIADMSDLGVSLKYVGGVANAAGLEFGDTMTAISLLAKAGIRGSTAGTSLRQMMISFGGATGPAREALKELGILTEDGTNKFYDQQGALKPLGKVFQVLQDATSDLTQKQRLQYLRTIFNNRALSAAAILTRGGAKGFKDMYNEMSKISAADVASQRLDNLSGRLEILRSNVDTVMIKAGTPFQEMLMGWVDKITELVQAFGALDEETQKFIFSTVAISGAALLVMGLISIIIGTIFRFLASMQKLGAAFGFAGKLIGKFFKALKTGFMKFTLWGKVLSIILLLAGAIQTLWEESDTFRTKVQDLGSWFMEKVVDPLVEGVDKAIEWLRKLKDSPGEIADELKGKLGDAVDWVKQKFIDFGDSISNAFGSAKDGVADYINSVVEYFQELPGRVGGALSSFAATVGEHLTLENAGYVIGYAIGAIVRQFLTLEQKVRGILQQFGISVVGFFMGLPARIMGFLTNLSARVTMAFGVMTASAIAKATELATGVVAQIATLPGRISAFVSSAANSLAVGFASMVASAVAAGPRIVAGIMDFVQNLPSRVGGAIAAAAVSVAVQGARAIGAARNMGSQIYNGVMGFVGGIPGAIAGALSSAISMFTGMISQAFAAAKSFSSGLWEGFKDGIGMNSPSLIEKKMWELNDVVSKEAKVLGRQTMQVQTMSKRLAQKMELPIAPTLNTLASTRRMEAAMNQRAVSQSAQGAAPRKEASTPKKQRLVSGELKLDRSGRAFIQGVAEEVYDDGADFDNKLDSMGRA